MTLKNIDDKHEKILQAAIKVFAKNGFHKSKISQIANEAGVADGTIYLYFKNKDDILIKLFEENLETLISQFKSRLEQVHDPVEKLKTFIHLHLTTMEANQALAEVLTVELRQSHKFMKEYVPRKFADYMQIVSYIVREGKDQGVFDAEVKPGVFKRALFGALDEMVLYWVLTPKRKYSLKTAEEQIYRIFVKGILVDRQPVAAG
ncbi:MAG: TetR/AcrR family transcriptional regulator [Candidatus Alcyoniella australis]|nr:TetR/AcrR family transcriptional regulator [Candidatus Alcyoniella australis]